MPYKGVIAYSLLSSFLESSWFASNVQETCISTSKRDAVSDGESPETVKRLGFYSSVRELSKQKSSVDIYVEEQEVRATSSVTDKNAGLLSKELTFASAADKTDTK